jgi:subtilisin family serine protease
VGLNFAGNDRIVYDSTADDHGTHVAGTIGAEGGNNTGVVGVNWNVSIISLKFLAPFGSTANAIRAVDYLTDLKVRHGMNIVASNNSWGRRWIMAPGLHAAIIRSAKNDILFFAAAGNSNQNNDVVNNYPSNYSTLVTGGTETPAAYEGVIAVANITASGASREPPAMEPPRSTSVRLVITFGRLFPPALMVHSAVRRWQLRMWPVPLLSTNLIILLHPLKK